MLVIPSDFLLYTAQVRRQSKDIFKVLTEHVVHLNENESIFQKWGIIKNASAKHKLKYSLPANLHEKRERTFLRQKETKRPETVNVWTNMCF